MGSSQLLVNLRQEWVSANSSILKGKIIRSIKNLLVGNLLEYYFKPEKYINMNIMADSVDLQQ